jgi:hypothetical protein
VHGGVARLGRPVAWDLVQTFLAAEYDQAERYLRRLKKVAALEGERSGHNTSATVRRIVRTLPRLMANRSTTRRSASPSAYGWPETQSSLVSVKPTSAAPSVRCTPRTALSPFVVPRTLMAFVVEHLWSRGSEEA